MLKQEGSWSDLRTLAHGVATGGECQNVLDERLKWAFQKLNKPSINSNNSFYFDVVRFIEVANAAGESNRALIELANRRLSAGNMSTPLKKLLSAGLAKESHPNLNILKQDKVRHTLMASALSVEFIMQEQSCYLVVIFLKI